MFLNLLSYLKKIIYGRSNQRFGFREFKLYNRMDRDLNWKLFCPPLLQTQKISRHKFHEEQASNILQE